jgi:hypothetical protein
LSIELKESHNDVSFLIHIAWTNQRLKPTSYSNQLGQKHTYFVEEL